MADDTPSDPQPVLLWIWRHFTLYVEEHRSLSNAQATYDRLHAVYGDRVHLVGLS